MNASALRYVDVFNVFQFFDEAGTTPESLLYVSPSLDMLGTHNPSIRVFELDDASWEVLDYSQYFFDLKLTGPSMYCIQIIS